MQSPIPAPPESAAWFIPSKLLIVRLGSMGDIIHTLPAATALRQAFPHTSLGWAIEERWAELLCALPEPRSGPLSPGRPLVDRVHAFHTKTWRKSMFSPQTWEQSAAGLSELLAQRYEVAVDFQGAAKSALLARFSGARMIYGMAEPREDIASMLYTRHVMVRGNHVVEQNLSLAESVVRRPLPMPKIQFPRDEAAENRCQDRSNQFILINPGAGWGAKQWPAECYGQVASQLAQDGMQVLINFGPGEEPLMRAVVSASGDTATGVTGSLTELIALTRRARLFIGGDTGPLHLAAALGIPVVAIFGPTNPARNGPFGTRSVVLRSSASSTSHARRAEPDPGMLEISPDEVVAAARELLESDRG
jgi:lipopolysaccharide heptosyltransferase I